MIHSADSVFRRSYGTEGTRFGNDFVVLDQGGKILSGFNASGAVVWALLDGRRTVADISREVEREFGLTPEQAVSDVLAFLAELCEKNLAEPPVGGSVASKQGGAR